MLAGPCWSAAGPRVIAAVCGGFRCLTGRNPADLRGLWRAPWAYRDFRGGEGTAKAVWVRARPGFKFPSLRSWPGTSPQCPSPWPCLIDYLGLRMAHKWHRKCVRHGRLLSGCLGGRMQIIHIWRVDSAGWLRSAVAPGPGTAGGLVHDQAVGPAGGRWRPRRLGEFVLGGEAHRRGAA